MAFRPGTPGPDLDRLKSSLLTSGLQQKDNALYQVINQLIDFMRTIQVLISGNTDTTIPPTSTALLASLSYLTDGDESSNLINSRRLLAGAGIAFDDSVSNERTISVDLASSGQFYAPVTDGDEFETLLIFANGECVMAVEYA